jgi:hypothetical protein
VSLANLQSALAELFTEPLARSAYERNRSGYTAKHGLTEREAAQLAALSAAAIAAYAGTLVRKRRSEAMRLLPRTRAALGAGFAAAFDAWAAGAPLPSGPRRHADDALAFCRHVRASRAAFSHVAHDAARADARGLRPSLLHALLARR